MNNNKFWFGIIFIIFGIIMLGLAYVSKPFHWVLIGGGFVFILVGIVLMVQSRQENYKRI